VREQHGAAAIAAYLGNPNVHHFGHIAYLPALLRLLRTPNVFSASSVDQWPHQFACARCTGTSSCCRCPTSTAAITS
jgi:hypothetical protein